MEGKIFLRCKICQRIVRYPANSSKIDQICGKCKKNNIIPTLQIVNNVLVTLFLFKLTEQALVEFRYTGMPTAKIFKEGMTWKK